MPQQEERLVVFIDSELNSAFENYIKEHGHTKKWMITYLIRELVKGKTEVKRKVSGWSKSV